MIFGNVMPYQYCLEIYYGKQGPAQNYFVIHLPTLGFKSSLHGAHSEAALKIDEIVLRKSRKLRSKRVT